MIDLLSDIKTELESLGELVGSLEEKLEPLSDIKEELGNISGHVGEVETKLESFSGLSDLAQSLTEEGFFTDSFAERVGEKFNEGISEALTSIGENLGGKLETIAEKLDEVNSSVSDISLSSD